MKRMKTGIGFWAAAAGAGVMAAAAMAHGGEIVVTASRDWRDAAKTPASVTVLSGEEIRKAGALNVAEALQQVGGLNVRSFSGNASQAEVSMRGFGENAHGRVLVLLDGQRLNSPDMAGVDWLQIPLGNVERIEVLRGGASALYGDNAVGGVIHILTTKGSKEPRANVSLIAGSFGTTAARAGVSGAAGKASYAAGGEWQDTAGYRDRSGYSAEGAGASVGYDLSDGLSARIGAAWSRNAYELPGWLTKAQMREDPEQSQFPDDEAENEHARLTGGLDADLGAAGRAALSAYLGTRDQENDLASWSSYSDSTFASFGVSPKYMVDWTPAGRPSRLTAGVDCFSDTLDVDRYADGGRTQALASARIERRTLGAYVHHETDLARGLVLSAGARSERADLDARVDAGGARVVDDDDAHEGQAFDAGLSYALAEGSKVFAQAGTVYRYPFVDEQVSYVGFGSDTFNRDLDAEKGVSMQVGAEFAGGSRWRCGATLFQLDMRDEIGWNPVLMQNDNLDDTRRRGVEAEAAFRPVEPLTLKAGYTFTEAQFTKGANDGQDVPLVPAHQASAGAELALPLRLTLEARGRYTGEQWLGGDNANAGDKLDDFVVADAYLRYAHSARLDAFVGVENAFDEEYASTGYRGMADDGYYPSPGIGWRVGVNGSF